MDLFKIKDKKEVDKEVTPIWALYQKGKDYMIKRNVYKETDENYRNYNENQWYEVESGSIEPITYNIIKPTVKYKVGTINANLFAIHYSAENYEDEKFQKEAEKVCELLNKHVARVWENDYMDYKIRQLSKRACINSQGIIYFDMPGKDPKSQILSKTNVYLGDENEQNIQEQPYIIIATRKPLIKVKEYAKNLGISQEEIENIVPDNDTTTQSGDSSKYELEDKALILTKLFKKNGTVWVEKATRHVQLTKPEETNLTLYPLAHFIWEEVEGSARGTGEVKQMLHNQREINKNANRRALAVKIGAYPQKIANISKIQNPEAINKVGSTITTEEYEVDDVRRIYGYIQPATMSPDATNLQQEMITNTRELAGAGDIATGDINPEQASGRSILAVQQASQQPLTEQSAGLKMCIEDIGRIYFDMYKTYNAKDGMIVLEEVKEQVQNEFGEKETKTILKPKKIEGSVLQKLKTCVKVDVTPKSAYDKYATEQILENYFLQGLITLAEYIKALPDDSIAPKKELEEIQKHREEEQARIQQIEKEAIKMQNQMNGFIQENERINNIDAEGQQIIGQLENSETTSM